MAGTWCKQGTCQSDFDVRGTLSSDALPLLRLHFHCALTQVVNCRPKRFEVWKNSCVDHSMHYGLTCQYDVPTCQRLTENSFRVEAFDFKGSLRHLISIMSNMVVIERKLTAFAHSLLESRNSSGRL